MTVSTLRSSPSAVRDGLQEASGSGGHVQKLLKGANALMATLDRLEKLMLSLQGVGGPRGSASPATPTPFSSSSFASSPAVKPAVELNPAPRPPSGRSL